MEEIILSEELLNFPIYIKREILRILNNEINIYPVSWISGEVEEYDE